MPLARWCHRCDGAGLGVDDLEAGLARLFGGTDKHELASTSARSKRWWSDEIKAKRKALDRAVRRRRAGRGGEAEVKKAKGDLRRHGGWASGWMYLSIWRRTVGGGSERRARQGRSYAG